MNDGFSLSVFYGAGNGYPGLLAEPRMTESLVLTAYPPDNFHFLV
jgi:hypothetical protein